MVENPELLKQAEEPEIDSQDEHLEPGPLDPQYPLLREFADKARGTFNHTQTLVMMVENVAAAIDLPKKRTDNLKLAAMYHDIGKMLNPEAFSENQMGDNIHNGLDPYISYQLITRHVSDSGMILLANSFPVEVIRIVLEHHGNSVLKPFFSKAKEKNPKVLEEEFRYRTPRPGSIESLLLMLCDVVESTTRSIYVQQGKNPEPDVLVSNIFNAINMDGQFNEVEIKLGRLASIQKALISDVSAKYHKREAYPEDKELMGKSNVKKE